MNDAQSGLIWVFFWLFDFPVSLLHMAFMWWVPEWWANLLNQWRPDFCDVIVPGFIFGIGGSLWYALVPTLLMRFAPPFRQRGT